MQTSNQTVLITGGTRGIGLELATRFVEAGNQVIITGRNSEKLAEARLKLPEVEGMIADMTCLADLERLHSTYPNVTVLINNAAIQYTYPLCEAQESFHQIENEIYTNFVGLVQLTALYLPNLLTQQESAIVNFTSGLGYVPKQSAPIYCATKSVVHMFSKSLRWQLESTSTRVFEVVPPLVDTDMTTGRGDKKISTRQLVDAFWAGFQQNHDEIVIGKAKLLMRLNRWLPSIAEQIMRNN